MTERPDAVAPKNLIIQCDECGGPKYADAGDFEKHPELLAAAPPSDACSTCGKLDNDYCSNPFHVRDLVYKDGVLQDAAQPVAWRWRQYLRPRTVFPYWGGWHYQDNEPHLFDCDVEIQPLYAHPEDAPGGPWEWMYQVAMQVVRNRIEEGGELDPDIGELRDALDRLATEGETDG